MRQCFEPAAGSRLEPSQRAGHPARYRRRPRAHRAPASGGEPAAGLARDGGGALAECLANGRNEPRATPRASADPAAHRAGLATAALLVRSCCGQRSDCGPDARSQGDARRPKRRPETRPEAIRKPALDPSQRTGGWPACDFSSAAGYRIPVPSQHDESHDTQPGLRRRPCALGLHAASPGEIFLAGENASFHHERSRSVALAPWCRGGQHCASSPAQRSRLHGHGIPHRSGRPSDTSGLQLQLGRAGLFQDHGHPPAGWPRIPGVRPERRSASGHHQRKSRPAAVWKHQSRGPCDPLGRSGHHRGCRREQQVLHDWRRQPPRALCSLLPGEQYRQSPFPHSSCLSAGCGQGC